MFTESVIQQIEGALGDRHPQADALLFQRVDFICKKIKQLRKDASEKHPSVIALTDDDIDAISLI